MEKKNMMEELNVPKQVTILGIKYTVEVRNPNDDSQLAKGPDGYTDVNSKKIILANLYDTTAYHYISQYPESILGKYKHVFRHEITHAFLHECGLGSCSGKTNLPWAINEEMVDWISIQAPKLYKIWEKLGLLD
jgi:hypothetical protein